MQIKKIVNFIFELGQLKRQVHTGFQLAGVKDPVTIAEHSLRAAQIGYILAVMEEDVNPEKVACMLIIHDNPETRVGDQNKIGANYYSKKAAEDSAFEAQLVSLGEAVAKKWRQYYLEFEERSTKEGIVAKDADWLEVAFQAKEYLDLGYASCIDWINNVEKAVETGSAKKIIAQMKDTRFTDWWKDLKKMTYDKLDNN